MESFGTEVNRRYCWDLLKNETERFHYSLGTSVENMQKVDAFEVIRKFCYKNENVH